MRGSGLGVGFVRFGRVHGLASGTLGVRVRVSVSVSVCGFARRVGGQAVERRPVLLGG